MFQSLSGADSANHEYYAALTAEERLALVFELMHRHREAQGEATAGLARVYRVTELERS